MIELQQRQPGNRLTKKQQTLIVASLVDELTKGYINNHQLAKKLGINDHTVQKYREQADVIIGQAKLDRNIVRNLQVKRTYNIIENLMIDLKKCKTIKDKTLIYNQIAKFSQHLALITGLNTETHVNVDHKQLVIIRANPNEKPQQSVIDIKSQPKKIGRKSTDNTEMVAGKTITT